MKILLKLKRDGGSQIELGKNKYHFKPNGKGHHVADVEDPAHIKRLLSIPGYYAYNGDEPDDDEPAQAAQPTAPAEPENLDMVDDDDDDYEDDDDPALLGSESLPAVIAIAEGVDVQLGEVVAKAHEISSLSAKEWNELPQEERDQLIVEQIDVLKAVHAQPATGDASGDGAATTTENPGEAAPAATDAAKTELTPQEKRKATLAAKAAGGNSKPASTKPKKNPALAKK